MRSSSLRAGHRAELHRAAVQPLRELNDAPLKARVEALRRAPALRRAASSSWTAASAPRTPTPTSPASAAPKRVVFLRHASGAPGRRRGRGGARARAGHFKLRHIRKRIAGDGGDHARLLRAARLALDAACSTAAWARRRISPCPTTRSRSSSCLLVTFGVRGVRGRRCLLAGRVVTSLRPIAFASIHADGGELASALLKLHEQRRDVDADPIYAVLLFPSAGRRAPCRPRAPAPAAIAP